MPGRVHMGRRDSCSGTNITVPPPAGSPSFLPSRQEGSKAAERGTAHPHSQPRSCRATGWNTYTGPESATQGKKQSQVAGGGEAERAMAQDWSRETREERPLTARHGIWTKESVALHTRGALPASLITYKETCLDGWCAGL